MADTMRTADGFRTRHFDAILEAVADPARALWRLQQIARTERELAALSDAALADIGLTRSDIPRVARECC